MRTARAIASVWFAICIVVTASMFSEMDIQDYGTTVLIVVLISFGLFIHFVMNASSNWMRIDVLFLIGYCVVFFQWPIMFIFFELSPQHGFQVMAANEAHGVLLLSSVGFFSWLAGYNLPFLGRLKRRSSRVRNIKFIPYLLVVSLGIFSLAAGTDFFSRSTYMTVSYASVNTVGQISAYALDIVELFARLSVAVLIYRAMQRGRASLYSLLQDKLSLSISVALLLFCLTFLVGGERGQVVMVGLGLLISYGCALRPIGLYKTIGLTVLGFVLFSFLGLARAGIDGGMVLGAEYGYWEVSINLAQSFVTVANALVIVEQAYPIAPGQVWLSQTLGIIPFAQSIFLPILDVPAEEASSALLITRFALGPSATTGLGTSIVADIYLAFGLFGVVFFLVAFGIFCRNVHRWLSGEFGFERFYVGVIFAGYSLYIARSSLLFAAKPIIWGLLLLVVLTAFKETRSNRVRESRMHSDSSTR